MKRPYRLPFAFVMPLLFFWTWGLPGTTFAFKCTVMSIYKLTQGGGITESPWNKELADSTFSVNESSGAITGQTLTTIAAKSTQVIFSGSSENSFKAIADFGNQYQIIEIQVWRKGREKPFVAMSMGGAGIVTGSCIKKPS